MATYSLSGRNLYAYNAGKNWGVSNVTNPTSIPSPQALAAGDKIVFDASSLESGTEAYLGTEGSMGFNVSSQAGSYDLALRCAYVTFTENWKNELRFTVLVVEPNSESEMMGMTEYYVRLQQDSITPSPTPEPAEGTVKVLGENAVPFLKEKMEALVDDNLGKAKVLTTADYNYPVDNPTKIAAWLLDDGLYEFESTTIASNTYYENGNADPANPSSIIMFEVSSNVTDGRKTIVGYYENNGIMSYPSFSMTVNASTGKRITNGFYYNLSTHSVEQSTGTNTNRPMSQNAVTSMVFADPSTKKQVSITGSTGALGTDSMAIGYEAMGSANANQTVSLGAHSQTVYNGTVALGAYSGSNTVFNANGIVAINSTNTSYGFNNSNNRVLRGVYEPQRANDAATKGYVDTQVGAIDTALQTLLNGTGA